MAKLTLREAAKMFDISRPTLSKALKSGKITGEAVYRDGAGSEVIEWRVDASEMARLYRPRIGQGSDEQGVPSPRSTAENRGLQAVLEAKLEQLQAELAKERHETARERQARMEAELAKAVAEERRIAAERVAEIQTERVEEYKRVLLAGPVQAGAAQSQRKRGWWPFG